ncbi:MAG: Ig-like domain-containing protein [Candidatus Gracilibacteria bacterium]|jgi:hypothetical protein
MKNNKKLNYLFGGLLLIAIVGLGVFAGSGYLFKGALTPLPNRPSPSPIYLPTATKPPAPEPKYSSEGAASAVNKDKIAPNNQDKVFAKSVTKQLGESVTIVPSGDPKNDIWFAPIGKEPPFTNGLTVTHASGNATSIPVPAKAGTYQLYVRDAAGNYSEHSAKILTVVLDNTAPIITIKSPKDGQTIHGKNVTVSATATDNIGVTKVEFYSGLPGALDDTPTKLNNGVYEHPFNLPLSDTTVVLSVWAYDAAGNIRTKSIYIKVANQAPDLSVSYNPPINLTLPRIKPTDLHGPTESLKLNMKVDATSPHDISKIEFLLDGKPLYNSYNKFNDNKGFFDCSGPPDNATCYLEIERSAGIKEGESSGKACCGTIVNPIMFPGGDGNTGFKLNGATIYHTLIIKAYDDIDTSSEQQIKFHLDWWNGGDIKDYGYTWIVIDP